jgi:hypothetical protein
MTVFFLYEFNIQQVPWRKRVHVTWEGIEQVCLKGTAGQLWQTGRGSLLLQRLLGVCLDYLKHLSSLYNKVLLVRKSSSQGVQT